MTNDLLFDERYSKMELFETPGSIAFSTHYKGYPITTLEKGSMFIIFEGCIYNHQGKDLEKIILKIADLMVKKKKAKLIEISKELDGEYILVVHEKKSNNNLILNDLFGHLPMYRYNKNGKIAISREIHFLNHFVEEKAVDLIGLAEHMIFQFALNNRTLMRDVKKVPPCSLIEIDIKARKEKVHELFTLNFEKFHKEKRSKKENLETLTKLFDEGCKNRKLTNKNSLNLLSLSGGLDSRAVAIGLNRSSVPFDSFTFIDAKKAYKKDLDVAKALAKKLDGDWSEYTLTLPKKKDVLSLLKMKNGLNMLSMSHLFPLFRQILKDNDYRSIHFITGDTGTPVRNWSPKTNIRTFDDLISELFSESGRYYKHPLSTPEEVCELLNLKLEDLFGDIRKCIRSYPEKDLNAVFLHFFFYNYVMIWHYEGMDRSRHFFWLSTPLESTQFFLHAISSSEKQKKYNRLYLAWIRHMDAGIADLRYSNWDKSPESKIYQMKLTVWDILFKLPKPVKRIYHRLNPPKERPVNQNLSLKDIKDEVKQIKFPKGELSKIAFSDFIKPTSSNTEVIELFTILYFLELYTTGRSSLEKSGNDQLKFL